jgi:hypothetical protein
MSLKEKQPVQIANNLDRHDAGQKLNFCLLPDPHLFSLPSTFTVIPNRFIYKKHNTFTAIMKLSHVFFIFVKANVCIGALMLCKLFSAYFINFKVFSGKSLKSKYELSLANLSVWRLVGSVRTVNNHWGGMNLISNTITIIQLIKQTNYKSLQVRATTQSLSKHYIQIIFFYQYQYFLNKIKFKGVTLATKYL